MTPNKNGMEIVESCFSSSQLERMSKLPEDIRIQVYDSVILGFRQCESILLPEIAKKDERIRELESILAEKVRQDILFIQKEDSVISRHEAMIAELERLKRYSVAIGQAGRMYYDSDGEYTEGKELQSIIEKYKVNK